VPGLPGLGGLHEGSPVDAGKNGKSVYKWMI
jgi:hypothetical protein